LTARAQRSRAVKGGARSDTSDLRPLSYPGTFAFAGAAELGGILGVFLTGFVLIEAFGTRSIIAWVAITLALLGVLCNPLWTVVLDGRKSETPEAEA
jgi:hypothetical protein